jgi:hypothetical protein
VLIGLFGKSGPKSSETKIAKLGECKGAKAPSSVPPEVPRFVMNITQITRFAVSFLILYLARLVKKVKKNLRNSF